MRLQDQHDLSLQMKMKMTDLFDRCLHDLLVGQCSNCMKPPWGINPIVYTTKGGHSFHNWNECRYLASGQDYAYNQGMNNHPINPVQWSAIQDSRSPCEWCCAIYLAGTDGLKKCKANIENVWIDALFARATYEGPKQKTNQVLDAKTGLVYFLSNNEVKF